MDRHSSDRDPFANHWREALEDAEVVPSERVWNMIAKSLDVFKYRHRAQMYGLVAAIAIMIAISVSIQSKWLGRGTYDGNVYLSQSSDQNPSNDQMLATDTSPSIGPRAASNEFVFLDLNQFHLNSEDQKAQKKHYALTTDKKVLSPDKKEYTLLDKPMVVKRTMASVLSFYPRSFLKEKSIKKKPHSWAGLKIGGSSFNPNYEMINADDMLAGGGLNSGFMDDKEGTVTSLDENMLVGTNRKIEVNLGMTIKERFVLEGGLQYIQTELVQQSNFVVENISYPMSMTAPSQSVVAENTNKSVKNMQETTYMSTETELENRIDFASVPLRAGYIFLDQRLSLRVNAGLVTNFYLGNIHRSLDEKNPIAEFRSNDNSLYRDISFSGQTGVSLGYRLLQNIDITFEPNYTQSFQSITRSYMGFSSVPNGFGVMAGVRYNFN